MRLLDLFCGAGGAAVGYHRAGFDEIVGVDISPQPRYPFRFVRADALDILAADLGYFDAVHASPPCQHYAPVTSWRGDQASHPDLIAGVRHALHASSLPYVIENVTQAPLLSSLMLCGTSFGLRFRRHRIFETNVPMEYPGPCRHRMDDNSFDHGGKQPESVYRDAMGCPWMTVRESREAVPPAYTQWVGQSLLRAAVREAAA